MARHPREEVDYSGEPQFVFILFVRPFATMLRGCLECKYLWTYCQCGHFRIILLKEFMPLDSLTFFYMLINQFDYANHFYNYFTSHIVFFFNLDEPCSMA